jgi:hypothetical protein
MQQPTKSSLSTPWIQLIEIMQQLGFGRIEQLPVRDGEPVLDPPPKVIRETKFGAVNGPRPEASLEDFALKAQVRELFDHLRSLRNATIRRLEVKHGLPFRMEVEGGNA